MKYFTRCYYDALNYCHLYMICFEDFSYIVMRPEAVFVQFTPFDDIDAISYLYMYYILPFPIIYSHYAASLP